MKPERTPASFVDSFGERVPYAVDNTATHRGTPWVPAHALDLAAAMLAGRFECCPRDIWSCPEIEEVCSCAARRDAGGCRSRLATELDPTECGPCWRALVEWLGDPWRGVHEAIALSKREEEQPHEL